MGRKHLMVQLAEGWNVDLTVGASGQLALHVYNEDTTDVMVLESNATEQLPGWVARFTTDGIEREGVVEEGAR